MSKEQDFAECNRCSRESFDFKYYKGKYWCRFHYEKEKDYDEIPAIQAKIKRSRDLIRNSPQSD